MLCDADGCGPSGLSCRHVFRVWIIMLKFSGGRTLPLEFRISTTVLEN